MPSEVTKTSYSNITNNNKTDTRNSEVEATLATLYLGSW
jgi:hypothetical protein